MLALRRRSVLDSALRRLSESTVPRGGSAAKTGETVYPRLCVADRINPCDVGGRKICESWPIWATFRASSAHIGPTLTELGQHWPIWATQDGQTLIYAGQAFGQSRPLPVEHWQNMAQIGQSPPNLGPSSVPRAIYVGIVGVTLREARRATFGQRSGTLILCSITRLCMAAGITQNNFREIPKQDRRHSR